MSSISQNSPHQDSPEIKQVMGALSKITNRSPEEIKPYVDELLKRLAVGQDSFDDINAASVRSVPMNVDSASFSETSTHEEWSAEFHQWVDSHKDRNIPVLSEEAMSRESMYPDSW